MPRTDLLLLLVLLLLPCAALAADDSTSDEPSSEEPGAEAPPADQPADTGPEGPAAAPPEAPKEVPPVAEPAPVKLAPPSVTYSGGLVLASPDGKFSLKVNGRVQTRFTFEIPLEDPESFEAAFSIPRARLKFSAKAFGWLNVMLHIDFSKGTFDPKDVYGDARLLKDWVHLRVGQFKRPSSRQFIASSSKLQFVDRAITQAHFGNDRDLGLMLHNGFGESMPFEYQLAFVNGTYAKAHSEGGVTVDLVTGEGSVSTSTTNVPDRFRPTLVARFGWSHGGIDGYSDTDIKDSPFGTAIGGGVTTTFGLPGDPSGHVIGTLDWILKGRGFSVNAAGFVKSVEDPDTVGGQVYDSVGFQAQTAFAIKGLVEPAIRVARIWAADPADSAFEAGGGVGVYLVRQKVKWVTDVFGVQEGVDGEPSTAVRVRSQLETSF